MLQITIDLIHAPLACYVNVFGNLQLHESPYLHFSKHHGFPRQAEEVGFLRQRGQPRPRQEESVARQGQVERASFFILSPSFILKVPKFVAEAWEASEDGAEVARLTAPPSGGGENGWKLTLDPSTATSGLSTFVLKVQLQTL